MLPFNWTFSGHIHGCGRPDCWNITVGMIWDSLSLKSNLVLKSIFFYLVFSVAKFHWETQSYF